MLAKQVLSRLSYTPGMDGIAPAKFRRKQIAFGRVILLQAGGRNRGSENLAQLLGLEANGFSLSHRMHSQVIRTASLESEGNLTQPTDKVDGR